MKHWIAAAWYLVCAAWLAIGILWLLGPPSPRWTSRRMGYVSLAFAVICFLVARFR